MLFEEFNTFQNNQKYSECLLVSSLNALKYLKQETISEERYEEYVDFLEVRNKGINVMHDLVRNLWIDKLGIYPKWTGETLFYFRYETFPELKKIPLPIQASVILPPNPEKNYEGGRHAVLIVDHNIECDAYQICNFSNHTNDYGWILSKDFRNFIPNNPFFILFDLIENI